MLIPITFKADGGEESRKGKLRPRDLAVLSAFSLPTQTGIFKLGNELAYYDITVTDGVASFKLRDGYVSVCGRIVYVEEGTVCTINLPASTESGVFGIRVNLGADESQECEFFYKTGTTLQTDDLNENPTSGVYEFKLYNVTLSNGATLTFTSKTDEYIRLTNNVAEGAIYPAYLDGTLITGNGSIAEQIESINARLTTLGFKTATISIAGVSGNTISRRGKIVYAYLELSNFNMTQVLRQTYFSINKTVFILPENFRPKTTVKTTIEFSGNGIAIFLCRIEPSGSCIVEDAIMSTGVDSVGTLYLSFGFEAY